MRFLSILSLLLLASASCTLAAQALPVVVGVGTSESGLPVDVVEAVEAAEASGQVVPAQDAAPLDVTTPLIRWLDNSSTTASSPADGLKESSGAPENSNEDDTQLQNGTAPVGSIVNSSVPDTHLAHPNSSTAMEPQSAAAALGAVLQDDPGSNTESAAAQTVGVCTGSPTSPPNSIFSCPNTTAVGSTCRAQCDRGFSATPPVTATCLPGGVWDMAKGRCFPVVCPGSPRAPANGRFSCGRSTLRGKVTPVRRFCTAQCDPGFVGAPTAVCTANGTWSRVVGQCAAPCNPNTCTPSLRNANGVCTTTEDQSGFACGCDIGWSWDPSGLRCTRCSVIIDKTSRTSNVPLNLAEVQLFSASGARFSAANLTVSMSSVFQAFGPQNCVDGNFNTFCHTPGTNNNEWLRVDYPCSHGLSRVVVTNRVDGQKERILQYRVRATEGRNDTNLALPYPFVGVEASYEWFVVPSNNTYCRSDLLPIPPTNAAWPTTTECDNARGGDACQARCAVGFSGTVFARCNSDGQWGAVTGACTPTVCPRASLPAPPANSAWPATGCDNINIGARCTGSCNVGFTGTVDSECQSNGQWGAPTSTCAPSVCPRATLPAPPANAAWPTSGCNNLNIGARCTGTCNAGFTGSIRSDCQSNGQWGPATSTCAAIVCRRATLPSPPANAAWPATGCDNLGIGAKCTGSCNARFTGTIISDCLGNGQWGTATGTCSPVPCGLNAYRDNSGNCACWSPNLPVGDGINCCRANAEVVGGACACKSGFTWNEAQQACVAICLRSSLPPAPPNAAWPSTGCNNGGVCTGWCNSDFVGSISSNCLSNGQWGPATSTCTRVSLQPIGCFAEPDCGPTRPLAFLGEDWGMTIEKCASWASARGFRYFAVQYYNQCFGGNDISKYTQPGTCNTPCDGNNAQMCGGGCANLIFAVPVLSIGCFAEPTCGPPETRALTWLGEDRGGMTIEKCAGWASVRGFQYSAVQWYFQCLGGNDISRYTQPGTCNTPCDGNNAQMCGGGCANSIFAVPGRGVAQPGGVCGPGAIASCPNGQCCSRWGHCGTEPAHCGAGCQGAWGRCA